MRLIATLHHPAVIRRIVAHVGIGASGPSPGPPTGARRRRVLSRSTRAAADTTRRHQR